jgi:hypothetical protein
MTKITVVALFTILSAQAFGHGMGLSSYPLELGRNMFSTEFTGVTSSGGGVGLQGRYSRKINEKMVFDAGFGISGGERNSRFFVATDYEIFPDYMEQPKFSIRTSIENAKEFGIRKNIISIAPKISKGFSFWGAEAFPYFAIPLGINLDSDNKQYESQLAMNLGITGNLPIEGYRNILGILETTIGVKDSYTALFAGFSFPIN